MKNAFIPLLLAGVAAGCAAAPTAEERANAWNAHMQAAQAAAEKQDLPGAERELHAAVDALGAVEGNEPRVVLTLNHLALLYLGARRVPEAENVLAKALEIAEGTLGEHLNTALTLHNLASAQSAAKKYAEAEAALRRCAAIVEKRRGPGLVAVQGRAPEAAEILERALPMWEKGLGAESVDFAVKLDGVARAHAAGAAWAKAEPHLRRELAVFEKALGPAHRNVGACLHNLAGVVAAQGREKEAEELRARAKELVSR
jgi:tetratricopeptide (TPR) repeat protein